MRNRNVLARKECALSSNRDILIAFRQTSGGPRLDRTSKFCLGSSSQAGNEVAKRPDVTLYFDN